ncbi:TPA: hypothetical protein IAC10_09310 [Candidatus Scatousia excrementigallinarum]|mgnify:CR=1 FL=1|uniref:Uncharacterized protein n=1 Tax=Candidatus Scatousia excrementigallinarum TaxID=2840935 RepID=A0A9D1F077_9BACT|nr:hypothetical protein [Candidatus Scatousia excrementigallinarum]
MGDYSVQAIGSRRTDNIDQKKQKLQFADGFNAFYSRLKSGEGLFTLMRSQGTSVQAYDGHQGYGAANI